MATDPVQRIRAAEHATPLALDLAETLDRLANAPPSTETPYLTVTLDWRPEGSEPGRVPAPEPKRSERRSRVADESTPRRPSWETLRRELDEAVAAYGPRGAAFDGLAADLERIGAYLDEDLDPTAQGVVIVACHAQELFEPVPLTVPVTTGYTLGPIPSLLELIHAGHDYPPYAVLLADQRDAYLWIMERQTWARGIQLEADSYPRKTRQGGWSQKRYQNRADERVDAFARTIAEETRRELTEGGAEIPYLIVAADEVMSSAIDAALHESVKERVLEVVRLPIEASMDDIAAAAEPLVERQERQHERDAAQAVSDGVGAGGRGVAGAEDTLTALETGQVMTLVMNDDFAAPGWADFTFPVYGVGDPPAEHPAAGDVANIVPAALTDIAIRLAIQTGADVELVATSIPVGEEDEIPGADQPIPRSKAARALDAMGGIGAVLRFALDEGQPTAER